jgi:hypothetical protein
MIAIITFNSFVFLFLSGLHFYWALGGRWAIDSVVPEKQDGKFLFTPGALASAIVATGLLIFGLMTAAHYSFFNQNVNNSIIDSSTWFMAIIFLLRAIGDFKFVGFFKKVKDTRFAKNDTKWFVPLCVLLSIFSFIIAVFS